VLPTTHLHSNLSPKISPPLVPALAAMFTSTNSLHASTLTCFTIATPSPEAPTNPTCAHICRTWAWVLRLPPLKGF